MPSTTSTAPTLRARTGDRHWRDRASAVIPPLAFGHLDVARCHLPVNFPQFFAGGAGARVRDTDGNTYLDLMAAWGPMLLGYNHPQVEAAVRGQAAEGDCLNGPTPRAVELAELLVDTVASADWAIFAKNGNDVTTTACTLARAATGRRKVLRAVGAYHGASPPFSPSTGGTTPEDRAHLVDVTYNDLASVLAAADEHDGDVAAVLVTPFRHDGFVDQEDVDPAFARGLREVCDRVGAVLILDEVRTGFRLDLRGSWEPLGVRPDLSAFSKALANGHPLAALTGTDALRSAIADIYVTGSFWAGAVDMAAAIATLTVLRDSDVIGGMRERGEQLRDGLAAGAVAHGVDVVQSGPAQMPFLRFVGDPEFTRAGRFCAAALDHGAYLHPWHNWFVSAPHTPETIAEVIAAADAGFAAVAG